MTLEKLFDVRGKTAVITGGGGALPGTLADALSQLGVRVALLDLNRENAEKRAQSICAGGGEARAFTCSVLDQGELEEARAKIEDLWGAAGLPDQRRRGQQPEGQHDPGVPGAL